MGVVTSHTCMNWVLLPPAYYHDVPPELSHPTVCECWTVGRKRPSYIFTVCFNPLILRRCNKCTCLIKYGHWPTSSRLNRYGIPWQRVLLLFRIEYLNGHNCMQSAWSPASFPSLLWKGMDVWGSACYMIWALCGLSLFRSRPEGRWTRLRRRLRSIWSNMKGSCPVRTLWMGKYNVRIAENI